jgi:hypothetical protein
MNKEDYVNLEVAKLLKRKGFNELCLYFYTDDEDDTLWDAIDEMENINLGGNEFSAPTLYEAQKWLRSAKGLHVEVSYMSGDYWLYEILTIPNHDLIGLSDRENIRYMSYEYALQEGILEALKLI